MDQRPGDEVWAVTQRHLTQPRPWELHVVPVCHRDPKSTSPRTLKPRKRAPHHHPTSVSHCGDPSPHPAGPWGSSPCAPLSRGDPQPLGDPHLGFPLGAPTLHFYAGPHHPMWPRHPQMPWWPEGAGPRTEAWPGAGANQLRSRRGGSGGGTKGGVWKACSGAWLRAYRLPRPLHAGAGLHLSCGPGARMRGRGFTAMRFQIRLLDEARFHWLTGPVRFVCGAGFRLGRALACSAWGGASPGPGPCVLWVGRGFPGAGPCVLCVRRGFIQVWSLRALRGA